LKYTIDWKTRFRSRELNIIFKNIDKNIFNRGLELGAGSHLQTKPLSNYCNHLISTEYETRFNISAITNGDSEIEYLPCDAEKVDWVFNGQEFDLVFSSNMMEHLPNPGAAIKGIYNILENDGISICTMPSVFMKILYLVYFYPAVLPVYLKRFIRKILIKSDKLTVNSNDDGSTPKKQVHENNPKAKTISKSFFQKHLFPTPHGAYDSNIKELFYWRKRRWINLLESYGFIVIKTMKLPVTTGYSFKLEKFCEFLYTIGFCSSYAYVAVKNKDGKSAKYFK